MTPAVVYHFTCAHGKADIGTFNALLVPHLHPWFGKKILWLTSAAEPDREKTGLTMRHQRCDRMEYRYVVSDPLVLKWCRWWPESPERAGLEAQLLADFENHGAAAAHEWWIADRPLPARFDRTYHRAPEVAEW